MCLCVQSSLTLTLPVNWFSLHLTIFLCSDTLSIDFIIYFSKNNLITSIYKLSGVLHSCPQVPISIQTREKHYLDISWVVYCSRDIELLSQISNIEKNNKSGIWSKLYENKTREDLKRFSMACFDKWFNQFLGNIK